MATVLRDLAGLLSWYLTVSLVGLIAFPLVFKYLRSLKDRGYTFMRVIGLLLWGFLFWLLSSLGVLENTLAGQILALIILVLVSGLSLRKSGLSRIMDWLRKNHKLVIVSEVVFLFSFVLWAFIRSANPEITGTEKPMELAFINAILRSPGMPPNDPWLSGYAISYYYFGYVLVAMLVRLTGVLPGVGFNLAIALWFAFSAAGAYGVIYNLVGTSATRTRRLSPMQRHTLPILGPLFLLIVSNLEGFLEVLHGIGLFWKTLADGSRVSSFWTWLDILDLNNPPAEHLSGLATRFWSFWRASRVIQDYDFLGNAREIIDEFPQFSYLLADLHPHVLAMPFVLLGVVIALNLFRRRSKKGLSLLGIPMPLTWDELLFSGLCLGSLGFLNLWDFPFAVLLYAGAYLLSRYSSEDLSLRLVVDGVIFFFLVLLTGVGLYLPFYLGFASQAGGLVPSLIFVTRGAHFWVMFAPLLVPVIIFLILRIRAEKATGRYWLALPVVAGLFTGVFILMLLAGGWAWSNPEKLSVLAAMFNTQGQSYWIVLMTALQRRLVMPGAWITLMAVLAGILALFLRPRAGVLRSADAAESTKPVIKHKPDFILVVMTVAFLLLVIPEFFFLKDQFYSRMNTIFKFYFHGWILLSMCATYAFIRVLQTPAGWRRTILNAGMLIVLGTSLFYAPLMLDQKTGSFGIDRIRANNKMGMDQPALGVYSLDGNQYFLDMYPEEAQAIEWLSRQDVGVVAEAIGGAYSGYARVSTLTGFPTVLGWANHESQWRGGSLEIGSRPGDIQLLYATTDWLTAEAIIRTYGIRYIYIGNLERSTYPVTEISEAKFRQNLAVVYEQGSVVIFEVTGDLK